MRRAGRFVLLALGLLATAALIVATGWEDVAGAFAAAGPGLLWVVAYHAVPLAADTIGWRVLFEPAARPAPIRLYASRWAGESVNFLLPVGQVGGEVVRARLVMLQGVSPVVAGATVLVDMTLGLFTQLIFAFVALVLLVATLGASEPLGAAALGLGVLTALILAFFASQRRGGIVRAARLVRRIRGLFSQAALSGLAGGAERFEAAVRALYRRVHRVVRCSAWRFSSWVLGSGEVALALLLLGHPVSVLEAVAVQGLVSAVRSAAFAIPGALGAQEGGFLAITALLGIPPEVGLALAIVRRVREVLFGLPGLLIWWWTELRRAPARSGAA